ncbi:MAG: hypothetical protein MI923_04970, partial [Phycisphaerales bacterium]|nr:hypothetical protein [Phycisphaerales bacterium]
MKFGRRAMLAHPASAAIRILGVGMTCWLSVTSARASNIDWGAFWNSGTGSGTTVIDGTTVTITNGNYFVTSATQPDLDVRDFVPCTWTITFSTPVDFTLGIAHLNALTERVENFSVAPTSTVIDPDHSWDGMTLEQSSSGRADTSTFTWNAISCLSFTHDWSNGTIASLVLKDATFFATPSFTVTHTGDSGAGSLRQAILDANASPGTEVIDFNIPGAGPHTIQPLTPLPTITDPVVIDGKTQPGCTGVPFIELDGSLAGSADGLLITAGSSTVRGLIINRFSGDGIELRTNGVNRIECNYIGTDVGGTVD